MNDPIDINISYNFVGTLLFNDLLALSVDGLTEQIKFVKDFLL